MSICPIPEGIPVTAFQLYLYCNSSRTDPFLYTKEPSPTIDGITVVTEDYVAEDKNHYNRVLRVFKKHPDDTNRYISYLRFIAETCTRWAPSVSAIRICSDPPKPFKYLDDEAQCQSSAWDNISLFEDESFGSMDIRVDVNAALYSSSGKGILLEVSSRIGLETDAPHTTVEFTLVCSESNPSLFYITDLVTIVQGYPVVQVPQSSFPTIFVFSTSGSGVLLTDIRGFFEGLKRPQNNIKIPFYDSFDMNSGNTPTIGPFVRRNMTAGERQVYKLVARWQLPI